MNERDELVTLTQGLAHDLMRRLSLGVRRIPARRVERSGVEEPLPGSSGPHQNLFAEEAPALPRPTEANQGAEENRGKARGCRDLEDLRRAVASCVACPLHRTRTQTVFADGTGRARVMFVGEAPGYHEDQQGVPFVGRAGELLTDIITKGMGLARTDVYIANVLKCRPPENRDPRPEEKELCTPFLDRQIELVNPSVVITLGLHAAHHVLRTQAPMGKLRGRVHSLGSLKIVATYHPAFLLRSPQMKKECWKDIQLAMKELGLPLRP